MALFGLPSVYTGGLVLS